MLGHCSPLNYLIDGPEVGIILCNDIIGADDYKQVLHR